MRRVTIKGLQEELQRSQEECQVALLKVGDESARVASALDTARRELADKDSQLKDAGMRIRNLEKKVLQFEAMCNGRGMIVAGLLAAIIKQDGELGRDLGVDTLDSIYDER
ncbi:MAG: hypothetical protein AAB483_02240 [Patescibacteria group bacterium]